MEAVYSAADFKKLPLPEMMGLLFSRVRDAIDRYGEVRVSYREKLRDALLEVRADLQLLQAEIDVGLDLDAEDDA